MKEIKSGDAVVIDYMSGAKFGHAITEPYSFVCALTKRPEERIGIQFEDGERTTAIIGIVSKITYTPK